MRLTGAIIRKFVRPPRMDPATADPMRFRRSLPIVAAVLAIARACTIRCRCHSSCRSRFSASGTQIRGNRSSSSNRSNQRECALVWSRHCYGIISLKTPGRPSFKDGDGCPWRSSNGRANATTSLENYTFLTSGMGAERPNVYAG
jgi:hypothetical protein